MLERVWVKEIRFRKRKNGKWEDWDCMGGMTRVVITTYVDKPKCEKGECYEERAVEFRRVEPETI